MTASKKPRRSKPTTRADFFALEEKAWGELTATWRSLPDEALLQPGACGEWSIKDVMNHIAAWQEATLQALPELLQGHKLPRGKYNIAKFNARQSAEDKDRTLAASRRRLERSRRDLLAFLATVPEAQMLDLKSRVGGWAKYNTYGHYDEHLYDLQDYSRQR
jgi:uncharacterized damage-inducible protein DinB